MDQLANVAEGVELTLRCGRNYRKMAEVCNHLTWDDMINPCPEKYTEVKFDICEVPRLDFRNALPLLHLLLSLE